MAHFRTVNPASAAPLADYEFMSDAALAAAVETSRKAFSGWHRETLAARLKPLAALGNLLETEAATLAELVVQEMGKPLAQARKEIEKCAFACRYYVEEAPGMLAPQDVKTDARRAYVAFEPLGPILSIMPWNFPYWQVIRVAAPALAAGNTMVLKHAENTTGVALALERLCQRAGFPAGVFQAVLADHSQIATLIAHDAIRAVTLTGSERAGRTVAQTAGAHLKKSVLELGGSDAYIVLADADIEAAAAICVAGRLVNSGQSCVAAKRFIVEAPAFDAFQEAFVAAARRKSVGNPLLASTDVGPLAKAGIRDEVARQTQASVAGGARVLYTSKVPDGGFYHPIVVLSDVKPGMPAFDEELFGPVAALIRAADVDTAFALANQSRFGLGGAVFSRDVVRAEQLARQRLEAGFVVVNGMVQSDPRLPFGGVKASGYGRELSLFGLRELVNVKTVVIN